jgi:hypothetical protein
VVTSFSSRLHPVPRDVMLAVPVFAIDNAPAALRFLREYMAEAPDELMVLGAFWTAPDDPAIPEKNRGDHVLFLVCCYLGSPEEAEKVLKPLRECQPTVADMTSVQRWIDVQKFFDEEYPDGRRYYWKSTFANELTNEIIERLTAHTTTRPSLLTSIDLWYMGGAFGRVGAEDTAFGSRDVLFTINFESNWTDPDEDSANIDWTRSSLKEIHDLSQVRTYLNFAGYGEDSEKLVRDSFGKNFARLQKIKAEYDPDNLFRTNFNISPKKS